ncbi:MAG TPA: Bax inhibitor-1 family protein [bacterium]
MGLLTQDQPIPSSVVGEDAQTQMAFLQKVYSLFLLGLVTATGGAFITMTNTAVAQALLGHFFISILVYFGVFFLAMTVRKTPGINVVALLSFTFVSGAFLAPAIMYSVLKTGSMDVVVQAAGITGSIFVGLTAYTFISKKDFSFLGGIVYVGLFAVIGIMLVNIFVRSEAADMAISWIGAVLFSLFILFDTSRIMRTHESDEYVSGALSLYLDFINLFLFILRILSGSRRS